MKASYLATSALVVALGFVSTAAGVFGHGNVTPQPVDTTGLPKLGDDWKDSDPFVDNKKAIEIGASGFNSNCARCHGLQMVSGGLAPDLRALPVGQEGDDIFKERVTLGKIQNGMTKMPKFSGILSQEALWAIRAYIQAKHEEN